jgi:transcriptional regulator with XRE-family HTH domain
LTLEQAETVLIYLSCRLLTILALSLAQLSGQCLSHSFAGSRAQSNLPYVLVRQVKPPGNVGNYAAYFGSLSEFGAKRSKIHGGYQLSEKALYAEPRMNVNEKTRLRVSREERPEIAEALRGARKHLGLTQTELAEMLGSSQGAITRWERGKDSPPISALLAMSKLVEPKEKGFWIRAAGFVETRISLEEMIETGLMPHQSTPPEERISLQDMAEKARNPRGGISWDPELLSVVLEALNKKLGVETGTLSDREYADKVVFFYELCHKMKTEDPAMVERFLRTA